MLSKEWKLRFYFWISYGFVCREKFQSISFIPKVEKKKEEGEEEEKRNKKIKILPNITKSNNPNCIMVFRNTDNSIHWLLPKTELIKFTHFSHRFLHKPVIIVDGYFRTKLQRLAIMPCEVIKGQQLMFGVVQYRGMNTDGLSLASKSISFG